MSTYVAIDVPIKTKTRQIRRWYLDAGLKSLIEKNIPHGVLDIQLKFLYRFNDKQSAMFEIVSMEEATARDAMLRERIPLRSRRGTYILVGYLGKKTKRIGHFKCDCGKSINLKFSQVAKFTADTPCQCNNVIYRGGF